MLLTTKVHIKQGNHDGVDVAVLRNIAYHAARMYNVALYNIRQHFFNTEKYLSYNENYAIAKYNENYRILQSNIGQQIMRLADRDMKSFFSLLLLKKSGKYSADIHLPRYKDKEGIMGFSVQGQSARIQKDGKIAFGLTKEFRKLYGIAERRFLLTIPRHLLGIKQFHEVRFIPLYGGREFSVEFIYEQPEYEQIPETADGVLSVDIGVTNLMSCVTRSNNGFRQFIIDGRPVKNINYYYNKVMARLKSVNVKNGTTTKRMIRLMNGRKHRIDDYFNRCASSIVKLCFNEGISTVIIGYNKDMKQEINIGKTNNQNFVCVPFHKLRSKLSYKCELHGIKVEFQEESYTSKASALDLDDVPVFDASGKAEYTFSGKRVKRGLYRSSDGTCINADINGSVNILRKYIKERKLNDLSSDNVRAIVNSPCKRYNLFRSPSL